MNVGIDIKQFVINNSIFLETKRNILMDGIFTKILYSMGIVSINGIYIVLPFETFIPQHNKYNVVSHNKSFVSNQSNEHANSTNIQSCKYTNNIAQFYTMNTRNNILINELSILEYNLLLHYKQMFQCNKIAHYSLGTQMNTGHVKIYKISNNWKMDCNDAEKNHFDPLGRTALPHHSKTTDFGRFLCSDGQRVNKFILKISGIWENATHYGITYKIMETNVIYSLLDTAQTVERK
jgi:hypothetical protein